MSGVGEEIRAKSCQVTKTASRRFHELVSNYGIRYQLKFEERVERESSHHEEEQS